MKTYSWYTCSTTRFVSVQSKDLEESTPGIMKSNNRAVSRRREASNVMKEIDGRRDGHEHGDKGGLSLCLVA